MNKEGTPARPRGMEARLSALETEVREVRAVAAKWRSVSERAAKVERRLRAVEDGEIVQRVRSEAHEKACARRAREFEQIVDGLSCLGLLRRARQIEDAVEGAVADG